MVIPGCGGEVALTVELECVERTDWAEEVSLPSDGIVVVLESVLVVDMEVGLKNEKEEEEEEEEGFWF